MAGGSFLVFDLSYARPRHVRPKKETACPVFWAGGNRGEGSLVRDVCYWLCHRQFSHLEWGRVN
jgi:hypothetical protein